MSATTSPQSSTPSAALSAAWEAQRPREQRFRALKALRRSKPALAAILLLVTIVLMAVFAPVITWHDPARVDVLKKNQPPAFMEGGEPSYPLGTDTLGRDVWTRLVYGSRVSLLVGLTVVAIGGILGTALGLLAGFYGGWLDDGIMRLSEIQLAFPFILLAITFLAVLGAGLGNLILVLGISSWVTYARVVRGQVMSVREKEFVEAAQSIGQRNSVILRRHILPNTFAPVIVIGSFAVASTIIAEASLSYLGLGVPPSVPTWGGMIFDGREYIQEAWWLVLIPGLAIMLTVLAINVLGDWLRDYLDPRLRT